MPVGIVIEVRHTCQSMPVHVPLSEFELPPSVDVKRLSAGQEDTMTVPPTNSRRRRLLTALGAGAGLIKAVGSPSFRIFLGVQFAPDFSDADGDGVNDWPVGPFADMPYGHGFTAGHMDADGDAEVDAGSDADGDADTARDAAPDAAAIRIGRHLRRCHEPRAGRPDGGRWPRCRRRRGRRHVLGRVGRATQCGQIYAV